MSTNDVRKRFRVLNDYTVIFRLRNETRKALFSARGFPSRELSEKRLFISLRPNAFVAVDRVARGNIDG